LDANNKSLGEAAARLGISPHTLRLWAVYQRRVPFLRLGRRIVFREQDLSDFERRNLMEVRQG
jgi:excisionase family DNA binding protein